MLAHLHRRRRPLGWVVLAILLALLPLRGWAETRMHLAGPAAELAMPCHGAAADADRGGVHHAMDATAGVDAPDATACALCALCHGSGLPAAEPVSVGEVRHAPGMARVPAGAPPPILPLPERPPRA
jgi:hypothetical protein